MNILLHDPYGMKFTADMKEWWEKQGHEVEYQRYYNPKLANEWADVIWFDTTDNNIASATNPGSAIIADDANYQPWDLHEMDLTGKKVIVRPIDIEVWQGHQSAAHWDLVNDVIFIADHIREICPPETMPKLTGDTKFHTIPCGVNLDRYTFRERKPGFDIAVISEKWISKGTDLILQIALKLKQIDPRYKIHWLGQRSDANWEYAYFDDFVEHHKLNIEFTNILNDGRSVDDFLEDKDYLLHASHKEAFSYATAEAMAKGIRPILHRFYGADNLWPGITWDSLDDAVDMITDGTYDSASYRQYLIDHGYTLPQMMEAIDKVINNKE
jgi:glycosyltransferase involved in cell wall biosynthesis